MECIHDAFLNYGGPPIPLVRRAMMREAAPKGGNLSAEPANSARRISSKLS